MAAPAQAALTLTPIDSDEIFAAPIYATSPPGDASRVFVVERSGTIQLVLDGEKLDTPFLSIPDVDAGSMTEGGLLSMAFPPDYASSGLFYVFMVRADGNPGVAPHGPIEIREYRRQPLNQNAADSGSGREVLEIAHAGAPIHYGGTLQFGPDGLLYASTGDGGTGANAEDTSSRLGKILRLDPGGVDPGDFTVPPTNPFANGVGGDPLVYSYGLRNPFRFSFDRATGDLTIGDVGENTFEEIDFAATAQGRGRGANFGWDSCEGFFVKGAPTTPCGLIGDTPPVHAYPHSGTGCSASITGGVVVRDPSLPTLAGRYLYGDFCDNYSRSICLPSGSGDAPSGLAVDRPAAFGEDASGRVLVVELSVGKVSRVVGSSDAAACPRAASPAVPAPRPAASTASVVFTLAGATRQRPLRSGHIGVRLRCDGACSARALGRLSIKLKGKRIRLREARGRRRGAGTLTLRLRVPAKARKTLRRALRGRRPVRAVLTIRVRDAAGKLALRQRTVRLVR